MKTLPLLALALLCCPTIPIARAADPSATPAPTYVIIVTGGELLKGVYPDGHTQFITRTFHPLGWQCTGSISVDDDRRHLLAALEFAANRAPVVLVTGGLGPTPNDITRETIAEFTGSPLREDITLLRALARQLELDPADLPENLRRQCRIPAHGRALPNAVGTAAGLVFDSKPALIAALPGPPRELQPMVTQQLEPYLRSRFGTRPPGASITLRFAGVRQSFLDQQIETHINMPPDILISSLFEGDRVDFTFTAADDNSAHRQQLRDIGRQLKEHLGEYLYTDDDRSLEQVVVASLQSRGAHLVLADAGTGGTLAAQLGQVPGIDAVLTAAFSAPTESALAQALQVAPRTWTTWTSGAERARGMAQTAAESAGATWAVGIGSVPGGLNESNSVWIAIKSPVTPWETFELPSLPNARQLQNSLATRVLNHLRLRLLNAPP